MDWNNLVTILVTSLLTGGGLGSLQHWREAKRAKKIENDKAAADEWKELYNRSEDKCNSLSLKLDEVYGSLRQEQEKRQGVEVALARAELCRCDTLKCIDRRPPFGGEIAKSE